MNLPIAIGQIEVIPARPDLNVQVMLSMIQQAKAQHIPVIVFPEMAISGYLIGDLWEQPAFLRDCEYYGQEIIDASQDICIIFGNVAIDWTKQGEDGRVRKYNACFIAQNGNLLSNASPYPFQIKTLQPNYREFDETRHFYSLQKLACDLNIPASSLLTPIEIKINDTIYRFGCILCEDGWSDDYTIKPILELTAQKASIIINISSSPYTLGKSHKRNKVFSSQAKETGCPILYVNNTGIQNNGKTIFAFDGSSTLYDHNGTIAVHCTPFEQLLKIICVDITRTNSSNPANVPIDNTIANVYQTLQYTLEKFISSIGLKKIVLGVSGGIDSAVSAAVFASIVKPENLLLVNMPSKFNSTITQDLAQELAKSLGCLYTVIPIEESVNYTVTQIKTAKIINNQNKKITSLTVSNLQRENIQARDRSARILAALAASFGGGFPCNANKSELSVGYSTFYGDLSGFIAPIADLWKHQVYELGHYINNLYPQPIIPEQIFNLPPSAELSDEQNIELGKGDPLHYDYHDYLFRAFMEYWNHIAPEDVLSWYMQGELEEKLHCQPGLVANLFSTPRHFIADLEKWWQLFSGLAIAKRIQAPPIIAVSRRAYGFDYRESQCTPYFTAKYQKLKKIVLEKH